MEIGNTLPNLEKNRIILNKEIDKLVITEGLPTFIHFWSYSCQICKQTLPDINFLQGKFKTKINIISVHMPRSEQDLQINLVKEHVEQNQIKHITIVDNQYAVADAFDNKFVPSCYLFDKLGTLVDFQAGELNIPLVEKKLNEFLN